MRGLTAIAMAGSLDAWRKPSSAAQALGRPSRSLVGIIIERSGGFAPCSIMAGSPGEKLSTLFQDAPTWFTPPVATFICPCQQARHREIHPSRILVFCQRENLNARRYVGTWCSCTGPAQASGAAQLGQLISLVSRERSSSGGQARCGETRTQKSRLLGRPPWLFIELPNQTVDWTLSRNLREHDMP